MADTEITLTVEPKLQDVSARTFIQAASTSLEILRDLSSTISRKRAGTLGWMITKLHYGSPAVMSIRAVSRSQNTDISREVVRTYLSGLKTLTEGKHLPADFSESALQAAKRLAHARADADKIKIQHDKEFVDISERIAVNIDDLLRRTYD